MIRIVRTISCKCQPHAICEILEINMIYVSPFDVGWFMNKLLESDTQKSLNESVAFVFNKANIEVSTY